MLYSIETITPKPDYRLQLVYSDGSSIVIDFKPLIAKGGVFSALADPDFFAQVSVGDRGRSIEWSNGVDFCADALRMSECFAHELESLAS
jgi:Protein of unknown function (DUF2442)